MPSWARAPVDEIAHTRVLLVSASAAFRAGFGELLSNLGFHVQAVDSAGRHVGRPHVAVIALDGLGPKALPGLLELLPHARVLVIGQAQEPTVVRAFELGVHAWLTPRERRETLEAAVLVVARGGSALSLPVLQILFRSRITFGVSGIAWALDKGLSPRQMEVLQLVARGLTDREIGDTLGISCRTVNRHTSELLKRPGCASRYEAARRVFGQVPPAAARPPAHPERNVSGNE